jgi:metal-dependent amidase/aminoacylase/carboxypeptidase family protein
MQKIAGTIRDCRRGQYPTTMPLALRGHVPGYWLCPLLVPSGKRRGPPSVSNPLSMGSEDFGRFGLENRQILVCQFSLGAVDPATLAESRRTGVLLPGLHSSLWAPVPEPTLRTGVKSMTSAILDLMKK